MVKILIILQVERSKLYIFLIPLMISDFTCLFSVQVVVITLPQFHRDSPEVGLVHRSMLVRSAPGQAVAATEEELERRKQKNVS